ncbi:hypothetical protein [Chelativorans sp.]|uniref:hypothetical protein n=1 Tax=Chelativorans sp. TaxID=2203393 RepID=UPI002811B228|nr:hypothetical protein [Chelativorans sp.]
MAGAEARLLDCWEVDMLRIAMALTRAETGWLRQSPHLADHLVPIPGLVSREEITAARREWNVACDVCHKHCAGRIKEVQRVAKVHRDPFEPTGKRVSRLNPSGEVDRY